MSDPDLLNVWYEQRLVGQLWRNATGILGFRYDPAWAPNGGFAISHSLPLTAQEFPPESGIPQRWFANLLPEGSVREHIVRDLKLPNTDFDLLRAIGGDCAGALSILPDDREPSTQRQYRPLTEKELANLVRRRGAILRSFACERTAAVVACGRPKQMPKYCCARVGIFCHKEKLPPAIS